jgi:hypothetical protein
MVKQDVFRHEEGGDGCCSGDVLRAWRRKKNEERQNEMWDLLMSRHLDTSLLPSIVHSGDNKSG